jgi:hypothetical protein
MKRLYALALIFGLFMASCGNNAMLDQSTATKLVAAYLESNPEYETVKVALGEIKFKSKNDKLDLIKYQDLQKQGYVDMTLQDQKKKFLSRDSNYVYLVTLTDKAKPFVVKQEQDQAILKGIAYLMDESKPATIDKSANKSAKVTVMLKKDKNPFTVFYQDKNVGGNFITKTFKLKYKKEEGWMVAGD